MAGERPKVAVDGYASGKAGRGRSSLVVSLRVVCTAGLLWFLFCKYLPRSALLAGLSNIGLLCAAVLTLGLGQMISALRLKFLFDAYLLHLSVGDALRAHFIGLWFNQILPGGISGDALKALILRRFAFFPKVIRAVVLERVVGLVFISLQIVLFVPYYFRLPVQSPIVVSTVATAAIAALLLVVITVARPRSIISLTKNFPFQRVVLAVVAGVRDIRLLARRGVLLRQLLTSAGVHFGGVAAFAIIGYVVGVDARLVDYLALVPIVFLLTMIPITVAGWGVREAGAIGLFSLVGGAPDKVFISAVIFGLSFVAVSLPGAIVFVLDDFRKN